MYGISELYRQRPELICPPPILGLSVLFSRTKALHPDPTRCPSLTRSLVKR